MLASKDQYLNEAAGSIFQFNADEQVRKLCRDREEYYQDLRNYERVIAQKDASLAEKEALIEKTMSEKNALIAENGTLIAERHAEKESFLAEIQRLRAENEQLKKTL